MDTVFLTEHVALLGPLRSPAGASSLATVIDLGTMIHSVPCIVASSTLTSGNLEMKSAGMAVTLRLG